jgi:hypothetical protein
MILLQLENDLLQCNREETTALRLLYLKRLFSLPLGPTPRGCRIGW